MASGCRVYYDFPFKIERAGKTITFNIDHIAVGPEEVFAIETKTRPKLYTPGRDGQTPHEVVFTGTVLKFP